MTRLRIEVEGEFSQDCVGNVFFGRLCVLTYDGETSGSVPPELVTAARAWLEEKKKTIEVTVRVTFSRDKLDSIYANGARVLDPDGVCHNGHTFPELATAGREWARKNPA